MDTNLHEVKTKIYDQCALHLTDFALEAESKEYAASRFKLNGRQALGRTAKITPRKNGQFVCFWKRNAEGSIAPFHQNDGIDFYVVNVRKHNRLGQFVFPRSVLIEKGIISTNDKEGKRAFRVYPLWESPTSKQAERSQAWQLHYFYQVDDALDFKRVRELYALD